MRSKIEMLKNALALGKFSQSKIVGIMGIIIGFSRKFLKPLLRRSLVGARGLHNSCNPYPAQKKFMLKKACVFLYFFQTALYIPIIPIFGAFHEQP